MSNSQQHNLCPEQLKQEITIAIGQYPIWDHFREKSIFITGGTGFFGKWLLYTLARANEDKNLNLKVHVLSRYPKKFVSEHPYLASQKEWTFFEGDIQTFSLPNQLHYDWCIHGAASASAKLNSESPLQMFNEVFLGTRRCLEECAKARVKRFLFLSSGAVYGKQPETVIHVDENFLGGPDVLVPGSAYAESKRAAEFLVNQMGRQSGMEMVIARAFAFVGPFLPLGTHFAIGNFILSCLKSESIQIKGDGTPLRSYLYASDLAGWLLTLMALGKDQSAYNVGSEKELSIKELAEIVVKIAQNQLNRKVEVIVAGKPQPGKQREIYCPSTRKIRDEFNLKEEVTLSDSIQRTFQWYQKYL